MKNVKIDAIVTRAKCPCGKEEVYNYNYMASFKELNSYIIKCPDCSKKYKVRYNPCTKKMFFINENNVSYTWVNKVYLGKITKNFDTLHDTYTVTLSELDNLESKV